MIRKHFGENFGYIFVIVLIYRIQKIQITRKIMSFDFKIEKSYNRQLLLRDTHNIELSCLFPKTDLKYYTYTMHSSGNNDI